ncbi:hypothetical protein AWC04_02505 [Mycolicibacterium fallax]|uniref:TrbL/VirB6 plasmid conjugal transfer protein n=1 Tax=Mycolicibacterium fallax TaxID=1793 RepID=A0A1X1RK38_MYCFA|nr:hypothetical protein AWC04_02505 [Mycolicibacterium fallax]
MRRAVRLSQFVSASWLCALIFAPQATAAGVGTAVAWSGLHDSRGVALGSYFIGMIDMTEAIRGQATDVNPLNPFSLLPGLLSRMAAALTYAQVSAWLGACCGFLLLICGLGISVVKFALGPQWLAWLASLCAPIIVGIRAMLDELHVVPAALLICLFVGSMIALTKGTGRGVGIMLSGFLVILLTKWFLSDPVNDTTGPNSILRAGQTLGFVMAMGMASNGRLTSDTNAVAGQVEQLGTWMVDVFARQTVQLMNFGQVIDAVPGCADAWDSALATGNPQAPVEAMKNCGAGDAYLYASQLSGESIGIFFLTNCMVLLGLLGLCYIAAEVLRIGFKAFFNLFILLPAAAVAVAPGPQRQFAKRSALKTVVHGLEMMFATGIFGVVVIFIGKVMNGTLPGAPNIDHPLAKIAVMMLIACGAAAAFRALLHAAGDRGLPTPWTAVKLAAAQGKSGSPVRQLKNAREFYRHKNKNEHIPGLDESGSAGPSRPGRRPHPPVTASQKTTPGRAEGPQPPEAGSAGPGPAAAGPPGQPGASGPKPPAPTPTPAAAGRAAPPPPPPPAAGGAAAASGGTAAGGAAAAGASAAVPHLALLSVATSDTGGSAGRPAPPAPGRTPVQPPAVAPPRHSEPGGPAQKPGAQGEDWPAPTPRDRGGGRRPARTSPPAPDR